MFRDYLLHKIYGTRAIIILLEISFALSHALLLFPDYQRNDYAKNEQRIRTHLKK